MSWRAHYVERVKGSLREFALDMETTIFTGKAKEIKLPWPAVIGEKCPYCHGYGHDDGGPGSWWCKECNGTGIFGAHYGERPIIIP